MPVAGWVWNWLLAIGKSQIAGFQNSIAMDITAALVLKVLGGFVVGGAHRTIARAAKEESMGWWLTAMFVPGGSIIYGLRRSKEFLAVVLIMLVGFAILGGGIGLHIYESVQEVRKMAASEAALDASAADEDEADAPEFTEIPASPVPAAAAATQHSALPAATSVPRRLQPKLQKLAQRYEKLAAERAQLDARDQDAVRAFNLRAEDYQIACRQFRSELAD
jgi:hypothetical protein